MKFISYIYSNTNLFSMILNAYNDYWTDKNFQFVIKGGECSLERERAWKVGHEKRLSGLP